MNDLRWARAGHDHGAALARDLGFSPFYLHYNTGRHVSTNGLALALQLEALVSQWPGAIGRLAFAPERQWVAQGVNHLDLPGSAAVCTQLRRWLA